MRTQEAGEACFKNYYYYFTKKGNKRQKSEPEYECLWEKSATTVVIESNYSWLTFQFQEPVSQRLPSGAPGS